VADGRDEVRPKERTSTKYAAKKMASERIAQQRAEQQRADRRRNVLIVGSSVLAIVVVVGFIIAVGMHSKPKSGLATTAASSNVVKAVTSVPTSAFDAVDLTTSGFNAAPKAITGQPKLTENGKAEVLYMGAEYCPYCAAERWPLAVALSRFGKFSNLQQTTSAASPEVYPSTSTLSFHGATYTSDYIAFTAVEFESNQVNKAGTGYDLLDTPTAAENNLLGTLDVSSDGKSKGGIPFIDFGNQYAQVDGANYTPQLLAGMTHDDIAAAIGQPTSTVGKAIIGTANALTAYICTIDGGKPATVCTSKGVSTAASELVDAGALK
jgi:hypothetical protein